MQALADSGSTGPRTLLPQVLFWHANACVTGLFIWLPIDDQRQRSFVTDYRDRPPGSQEHRTAEAVYVQTAVSAYLAVARRCVRDAYHGA